MSAVAVEPVLTARPRPRRGVAFLLAFSAVAVGLGAARALTTAYVPVLLDRIADRPALIGAVMLVNAAAGFAIPLVTGLWSDRTGRRAPFIAGGTAIAAGGLVAIALGTATSYLALGLAAATVYVGLNAAATAHRTLVADRFADRERPKATGAQEMAMLVGALVATVAGGVLIDAAPELLFGGVAVVAALLVLPTLALPLVRADPDGTPRPPVVADDGPKHERLDLLLRAARTPGAREVLLAQLLWVVAYAALTPFMVLYAEEVLGIGAAGAGLLLAAFGLLTGAGMLAAGRLAPGRIGPALALGTGLLGGGLVAATPASSVAVAALPFDAAAVGAGLVTALGFPYFARFIPGGVAGTYSGVFFSVRAIAATIALPVAGGIVAATGSYRWLLLQGGAALVALVPLARARRHDPTRVLAAPSRPPLGRVVAVIPVFRSTRLGEVATAALTHVDEVLVVDDGAPPSIAARAASLAAADPRITLLRRSVNGGKGAALADAYAALLARPDPPDAVLSLDSDGQHPPDLIPAFLDAGRHADVVVGDRRGRRAGGMPIRRRAGNALTSVVFSAVTRRRMRDTQNGMRLLRLEALRAVPLEAGGFEAETRHLKALARRGTAIGWVAIPTIYAGEPSAFRPIADSVRIARELMTRDRAHRATPAPLPGPGPLVSVVREWWPRLALGVVAIVAVGLLLPTLGPVDVRLYREVNALGDGPGWLYDALDPHSRNYALLTLVAAVCAAVSLRRVLHVAGTALAIVLAAFASDLFLEIGQILFDRPRPEEVLGAAAEPVHGRDWTHIPSFPSGHMMVTAAMVAAAGAILPRLKWPLVAYLVAIALTRVTFGAHFPLDVAVGGAIGWEVGLFSVALVRAAGLLPEPVRVGVPTPAPVPVSSRC